MSNEKIEYLNLELLHPFENNPFQSVDEKEYDEEMLEELIAFRTVSKQANRIKCATIGIKGFVQLIEESEKSHE